MRFSEFQWDEGNALHLTLRHGIGPEEAEEVFAIAPAFRTGWVVGAAERRYYLRHTGS
jgi:hypothetical protein